MITDQFIYDYIKRNKLAVVATVSSDSQSESALVGIAVTTDLKIIFDTSSKSRKYKNIVENQSVSLVIGWENETTIQYEGKDREKWNDISYICIEPKWIRYSDFNEPMKIEERYY